MNQDQILSLIRQILTALGSVLVAKGVVDADNLTAGVGAVSTLGSVIWSLVHHKTPKAS